MWSPIIFPSEITFSHFHSWFFLFLLVLLRSSLSRLPFLLYFPLYTSLSTLSLSSSYFLSLFFTLFSLSTLSLYLHHYFLSIFITTFSLLFESIFSLYVLSSFTSSHFSFPLSFLTSYLSLLLYGFFVGQVVYLEEREELPSIVWINWQWRKTRK